MSKNEYYPANMVECADCGCGIEPNPTGKNLCDPCIANRDFIVTFAYPAFQKLAKPKKVWKAKLVLRLEQDGGESVFYENTFELVAPADTKPPDLVKNTFLKLAESNFEKEQWTTNDNKIA